MVSIWKPWYVYRPAQILRRVGYSLYPPKNGKIVRLPWGCEIKVDATKTIGRSIVYTGVYELATSELLWRLIQPGDQALDIGANVGYMTALMGARVGPHGTVLAFEPHPQLFQQLGKNVERFGMLKDFGRVNLFENAVSDRAGIVSLDASGEFGRNDGVARIVDSAPRANNVIHVQAVVLDDLLDGPGDFALAKIDVEGHELQVLHGGAKIFRERVTHVVFEDHRGLKSTVCELLRSMGFELLQFGWSLRRLQIAAVDAERLCQRYEAPNFIATRKPGDVFERCHSGGWQVLQRR